MSDHPQLPALSERPTIRLLPGHDRRLRAGHPWAFSNEIAWTPSLRGLPAGGLVRVESASGRALGTFMFNPHSLIAARRLSPDAGAAIDSRFLSTRLAAASSLRARLFASPWYRLCHAEADGLPGLVIDRFGGVFVVSAGAAGAARLEPELLDALDHLFAPIAVIARDEGPARALEGLAERAVVLAGQLPDRVELEEGGVAFPLDLLEGQKTGWFYDQRLNRDAVANLAAGATVLDLYCHTGAFGLRCAAAGATRVTLADRSEPALALAEEAAKRNGLADRVEIVRAEAFGLLERMNAEAKRFDLVIADPPSFAKSRKDHGAALKGYEKLARLAASIVSPGGFLFLASCSHHVSADELAASTARGLAKAEREGRIIRAAGAGPDHPVHPHLPESAYLKTLLLQLD